MKAIILTGAGGIEKLAYQEVRLPEPKQNEVLIKVKAIGINPIDIKTRKGQGAYGMLKNELPIVLGWDVSGEVVAVGEKATKFKVGDEVFGMINFPGHGKAYAEYAVAPEDHLALKVESISHVEAAAASLAALTAWQSLVVEGKLEKGQRVLIHAAAGGVGHFAVQIAKHVGAYVVGTASSKNSDFLNGLGIDKHIDYTATNFEDVVTDIDLVLDGVGGDIVARSFKVLKQGGQIISIPSGMNEEWKQLASEQKINARSYRVHSSGDDMKQIAGLLKSKKIKAHVSKVYSFDEIAQAHKQIETGRTKGKLVVVL